MSGEPENACAWCDAHAVRKQGRIWLCAIHYRHQQMRVNAKRHGKSVPTYEELAALSMPEIFCMDCSKQMNWLACDGQSSVVSLQHYRDGTFGLVCRSCNTRHAFMDGDTYREMPKDNKQCPQCKKIKPFSGFSVDNGRSGEIKLKSWCKQCSLEAHHEWKNRKTA